MHHFGSFVRLAPDFQEDLGEAIEGLARFRFRGLDHHRFRHDQREVDGGSVHPEIHQALGEVGRVQSGLLERRTIQHELVHVRTVVLAGQCMTDFGVQVVGVQHRRASDFRHAFGAHGQDVGVGPHHHQEVAERAMDRPDGGGGLFLRVHVAALFHPWRRQEGREMALDAHGTTAGTTSAVRRGEGLVQIEVHHIETEIARPRDAHQGVEVRAVHVHLRARRVAGRTDLFHPGLEQTHGVGVGDHERSHVRAQLGLEVFHVDAAIRSGFHGDAFEPRDGSRGRIGAVGGIRDQDLLAGFAAREMVGAHHQQRGELAMGSGGRLQRHGIHAGNFRQIPLQLPDQLQGALDGLRRLQRVQGGKS